MKKPSTTPPMDSPPLPRQAIMPDKLETPKVTAIQDPPVDADYVEDFDEDYYLDYGLKGSNLENY